MAATNSNKYLSKLAKSVTPYVPGEQPKNGKYIKLNTNENPYPPSPEAIKAIKAVADQSLRLYPDPEAYSLREVIAAKFSLKEGEVFIGNGSDELLAFSFQAFFNPGEYILFPEITYSFYQVYCNLYQINFKTVSLRDDFSLSLKDFRQANGGIIFPNPNAPTGRSLALDAIVEILKKNKDVVVIIDEAYVDFGGESVIKLIKDYPNLLVIQTFSKSRSLAGLRVGFAMGQADLIDGLNRIKNSMNSYTVDRMALAGARAAFLDDDYFQSTREMIIQTRENVKQELELLDFKVIPSKTNFLFISHPAIPAEKLFNKLKAEGILARYFKQPLIDNYLRVTIGSNQEMSEFLTKAKKILTYLRGY